MSVEELIRQLRGEDETDRAYAAEDLGHEDGPEATAALVDRLAEEPSQVVREAICGAIERSRDPGTPERVVALLSHPEAAVRNSAVAILQSRGPLAVRAVGEALRRGDEDVRKIALDALASVESEEAHVLYERALEDRDINVRISGVELVGEHQVTRLRPTIERLFMVEAHAMMVSALFEALLAIGGESTWTTVTSRYPTLESVPPFQRGAWLRALGQFAPRGALQLLEDIASAFSDLEDEDLFGAIGSLDERFAYDVLPRALTRRIDSLARREPPSIETRAAAVWLERKRQVLQGGAP